MLYQSISTHSATREAAARETATRETATGEASHSAHTLACLLVTHRVNLVDDVYKSILVDMVASGEMIDKNESVKAPEEETYVKTAILAVLAVSIAVILLIWVWLAVTQKRQMR